MEQEISHSVCQYVLFNRPLPKDFCTAYNDWQEFSGFFLDDNMAEYAKELVQESILLKYDLIVISAKLMGII